MSVESKNEKPRWALKCIAPDDLHDHPVSLEIYGEGELDDELLASVSAYGVRELMKCTQDMTLLCGHRRRRCAISAGIESIQVLICQVALTDAEQIIEIVESNRYREKTREQKAREYARLAEAKAILAKARMESGKRTDPAEKFAQGRAPTAKDSAAAQVGMSRPTADKAARVVQHIDKAKASGDTRTAQSLTDTLNHKSVAAAHVLATKPAATHGDADDADLDDQRSDSTSVSDSASGCRKIEIERQIRLVGRCISQTRCALEQMHRLLDLEKGAPCIPHKCCMKSIDWLNAAWRDWKDEIGLDGKAHEVATGGRYLALSAKRAERMKLIPGVVNGVGVTRGNEAIDVLKRIPPDDKLRVHGFGLVADFIKQQLKTMKIATKAQNAAVS